MHFFAYSPMCDQRPADQAQTRDRNPTNSHRRTKPPLSILTQYPPGEKKEQKKNTKKG